MMLVMKVLLEVILFNVLLEPRVSEVSVLHCAGQNDWKHVCDASTFFLLLVEEHVPQFDQI